MSDWMNQNLMYGAPFAEAQKNPVGPGERDGLLAPDEGLSFFELIDPPIWDEGMDEPEPAGIFDGPMFPDETEMLSWVEEHFLSTPEDPGVVLEQNLVSREGINERPSSSARWRAEHACDEFDALRIIAKTLDSLPEDARKRTLDWLKARYLK